MTKTNNEYIQDVFNYWGNEYTITGTYGGALKRIKARHNICGTEWNVIAVSLITGHGCPNCSNNRTGNATRKSQDTFVENVYSIWGNEYTVIGEYKNTKTRIKVVHNVCNKEWNVIPCDFLRSHGCPYCSGNIKRTHVKFLEDVYKLVGDEYSVLGEYVNVHIKVEIIHNTCGYHWMVEPNYFLRGGRCPTCYSSPKGERNIKDFLIKNKIRYIKGYRFSDCRNILELPFDFYLPIYNLCIEADGEQHFFPVDFAGYGEDWAKKEFNLNKKRDKIKTKYCKDNNIPLLRIPYWDFDNIEQILTEILLQ